MDELTEAIDNRCTPAPEKPTSFSAPTAEHILRTLFREEMAALHRSFYAIGKQGELRWIVDTAAIAALDPVWEAWIPYTRRSRLLWRLIRAAALLRCLGFLPGVSRLHPEKAVLGDWVNSVPGLRNTAPIVFVGKPSTTAKLTVFLATPPGDIAAVAKIALVPGAISSIACEAAALDALHGRVSGIPRLLAHSPGVCLESWSPGRSMARTLTQGQVEWLLALPRSGRRVALDDRLQQLFSRLPATHRHRARPHSFLIPSGLTFNEVWEHGDFVPWNIKKDPDGKLAVVDWEYATASGMPLLDLLHFHYRQHYLFRDLGDVHERIAADPLVAYYCRAASIDRRQALALERYYLLGCLAHQIPALSALDTYEYFIHSCLARLAV